MQIPDSTGWIVHRWEQGDPTEIATQRKWSDAALIAQAERDAGAPRVTIDDSATWRAQRAAALATS